MRVLVFGNSGSGKSTYAKALAAQHGLAHLDLDSIVWEPGKIAVPRDPQSVSASLDAFIASLAEWVIEGCYGELVEDAAPHCTQLVFLNPGLETCQANNRRRPWEPHKYASMEQQDAMLANLQSWVADYYSRDDAWSYQAHRRIFDAHRGVKVEYTDASQTASAA
ncbi:shikimate kinase [Lysobacter psychrotolerans]|uniref:Shikimate kinase n=2 Tax=Montanilutibacter psychrotolerans TaxID=1327343 RepID=A0A3M8SXU6_9GAMM|nr:shikimate kinase [Lysobacter psychrotolerans]